MSLNHSACNRQRGVRLITHHRNCDYAHAHLHHIINRQDRDREYAKFKRTMMTTEDPDIAKRWSQACQENSKRAKTLLFNQFFLANGTVGNMFAQMRTTSSSSTSTNDLRGWLTRGQLIKDYGKRSEALVDDLGARKKKVRWAGKAPPSAARP